MLKTSIQHTNKEIVLLQRCNNYEIKSNAYFAEFLVTTTTVLPALIVG